MHRTLWTTIALTSLLLAGCASFHVEANYELSTAWSNYQRIIVQPQSGSVTLRAEPSAAGDVTVSGKRFASADSLSAAKANLAAFKVVAIADPTDAATLLITLKTDDGREIRNIGASMTIRVPAACEAQISTANGAVTVDHTTKTTVRTSNGAITASAIGGDAELHTSNGRIEARDVKGSLTADSTNGAIVLERIAGTCRVETSNGAVEARQIGGIAAISSNGSVTIVADSAQASIDVRTSNGRITIRVPESIQGLLDLSTSNGAIDTKLGSVKLTNAAWAKTHVRAEMNGGGAGGIHAETSNGSIRVECGAAPAATAADTQPPR